MNEKRIWRFLSLRIDAKFTNERDALQSIVDAAVERIGAIDWGEEGLLLQCDERTVGFEQLLENNTSQELFQITVTQCPMLFPEHEEELYRLMSKAGIIVTDICV